MSEASQSNLRQRGAAIGSTDAAGPAANPATQTETKKRDVFGSQGPQGWKRRHQGLLQDKLGRHQSGPMVPSFSVAVRLLLLVRVAGAMYSLIADCDEVFNFIEPLHYFQHNSGFQTWELSPQFAIRSWAYVLLHWPLAHLAPKILRVGKRQQFFALRVCLGILSSLCEAAFYRSIVATINERVGRYTLFAMAFSAGMFSASVAFLPSSFAMYTTMLHCVWSFHPATSDETGVKRMYRATACIAVGAIVGWPFTSALGIPFVIEQLFLTGGEVAVGAQRWQLLQKRTVKLITAAIVIGGCVAYPVFVIDSAAYGRRTFPMYNILNYNLFSGKGPDLYGTSPPHFYLANLFLNFNYLLVFALISAPALVFTYFFDNRRLGKLQLPPKAGETSPYTLLAMRLLPFYLWLGILTAQAHKEERFAFPIYPLLCFNAAVGVYLVKGWFEVIYIHFTKSPYQASRSSYFSNFSFLSIIIPSLLSASRILAMWHFYSAPLEIVRNFQYSAVPSILTTMGYEPIPLPYKPKPREKVTPDWDYSPLSNMTNPVTLCYGSEWHRYPGSYFIPNGVQVRWTKSEFDGMMPRPWEPSGTQEGSWWPRTETRVVRPGRFNGDNLESAEPGTYVSPSQCDYLVTLNNPSQTPSALEPDYANSPEWNRAYCTPFLDSAGSAWWARLFWVPGDLLEEGRQWGEYCLLKNAKPREYK